ncbi:MAG: transglutaminase-like domain-containing protein [Candidatus Daviesbacteria bacterium]|nr:transglutaminase-like domain-containing protein [Candidatus Daviesbacteria bacterium]
MRLLKLKILGLVIFFLFLFLCLSSIPVFADNEFSTSYDVSYDINESGVANVTQKITLKNLTDKYYPSNFILSIGSTNLTNISATDGGGVMESNVENKDNKTSISVKFNQQVTGLDKTQTIILKFQSKDFAQNIGKTWEVYLPKIPDSADLTDYNLSLNVPISFGDPTSITPKPSSQTQNFERQTFYFNKDQLKNSGVSVNFGTTQIFDFNIKYNLENNSFFPSLQSIVLPPNTQNQDIIINQIIPEPSNVIIDDDGNILAWYKVSGKTRIEVEATGSAKLYLNSKNNNISVLNNLLDYTKSDKYWESDNPAIKTILAEIFKDGEPKSNPEKAKLIYRFVVDHLKYDTTRLDDNLERLGAVTILNNPNSAVCMEFTDLFIALSRAANVPTRELDGFAYSQNQNLRPLSLSKDLLHSWPEYYDEKKGWVMVDPTWENTSGGVDYFNKFDLNHLVLAIKGISSVSPVVSDELKVTISNQDFIKEEKIKVDLNIPDILWAGLPVSLNLFIENTGNTILDSSQLVLNADKIKVVGGNTITLGPIPPQGHTTYKFNLRPSLSFQQSTDTIEVTVAGEKFPKQVIIKPIFMFIPWPYLLGIIIFVTASIYGLTLLIHLRRKSSHKRV